ncbi:hypothetical protein HY745_12925 [Candidatus Desantisbacteria bacterium]|nr:hypothetical protein [Candidatus Desantisbacteria bacterium]
MPSSTRLDKETEEFLTRATQYLRITKSEIIRKSIKEYCKKIIEDEKTTWQIYQSVHKPGGSNHGKRVLMQKEILRKKLEGKRKKWSS